MHTFSVKDSVGDVVARRPALSRVFEQVGIDYCCGGKKSLEEACERKRLDPEEIVRKLMEAESNQDGTREIDAAAMSLTELADHIEQTHHAYLRTEMPRLDAMTEKVASVHGEKEPRLRLIRSTFLELAQEVSSHMMKEERILFPMIRQLEASETTPEFHCGSIGNPIHQMEHEHDLVGEALQKMRELSDEYTPPEWACNTYRAMLDALAQMERDFHQHIHKENNVLFPKASQMEHQKQTS